MGQWTGRKILLQRRAEQITNNPLANNSCSRGAVPRCRVLGGVLQGAVASLLKLLAADGVQFKSLQSNEDAICGAGETATELGDPRLCALAASPNLVFAIVIHYGARGRAFSPDRICRVRHRGVPTCARVAGVGFVRLFCSAEVDSMELLQRQNPQAPVKLMPRLSDAYYPGAELLARRSPRRATRPAAVRKHRRGDARREN